MKVEPLLSLSTQVCSTAICRMASPFSCLRFKGTVVLDPANPSEVCRLSENTSGFLGSERASALRIFVLQVWG